MIGPRAAGEWGVVAAAAAVALAALIGAPVPWWPAAAGVVVAAVARAPILVVLALALLVSGRSHSSLEALEAPLPQRVDGVAELVSDPESAMFGVQVTLETSGRRYLAEVPHDMAAPLRPLLTGERVRVVGRPRPLEGAPQGWVRARHLAGRLSVTRLDAVGDAAPWYRLANGIHRTVSAGASSLGDERASLYTGLVLGDDRGQSELTRFRFQASGLTHLLAVSGQNVAFVLALATPLFRRLGRNATIVVGVALLVVFTLVTRAEPSVIRAAVMAAMALAAVTAGRVASGLRVLSLTVIAVLVADPLLVHSVGFQLSVAATSGLMILAPPIAERLPGPEWLRVPLSVTVAAQIATAPLLVQLAGGLPSIAVVTNLLAGPAAGAVMMCGVTVGIVAGLVRAPFSDLLQFPVGALVGWVDAVATHGSRMPAPVLGPARLGLLAGAAAALGLAHRVGRGSPTGSPWRRPCIALGLGLVVAALAPMRVDVGPHELASGATLWIGDCGGVVVELDDVTDPGAVLEGLWRHGIRRVDVLVAAPGRRATSAAHLVREQLPVRRQLAAGSPAPGSPAPGQPLPGTTAPPTTVHVGGVAITLGGGSDSGNGSGATGIGLSEAACSLAP